MILDSSCHLDVTVLCVGWAAARGRSGALAEHSPAPAIRASLDALVLASGFNCRLRITPDDGQACGAPRRVIGR
ncbi:MAG: hypothetical protein ACRDRI_26865 [Pseudonocardiaceae bacterium]